MENSNKIEAVKKEEYPFGDLEQIRLTSKIYSKKKEIHKAFWNKPSITLFRLIVIIYLSVFSLYPFIYNFKNKLVRKMSEQNRHSGLNQNYERIDPNDKNFTYIPIVGWIDLQKKSPVPFEKIMKYLIYMKLN